MLLQMDRDKIDYRIVHYQTIDRDLSANGKVNCYISIYRAYIFANAKNCVRATKVSRCHTQKVYLV